MPENKPFFSIVIPTYNRAGFILETLDSVFAQSFRDYEIIIVDNCSTDNTEELLQPLVEKEKIIYLRLDKNYERGVSRNTGMAGARGKYLTLLDSDDFLYPECLADAYDFACRYPQFKIFHNKFELVDNDKKPIYQFDFPKLSNQYKALCNGNFISCIGAFLHESIYTQYRFSTDPWMVGSEDYEIWFRILGDHELGRINKVNAGVRQHETRSVENTGIYNQLGYQQQQINNLILQDPELTSKYYPYLSRLNSWFYLKRALHSKKQKHISPETITLWLKAIRSDFRIIFKLRFYKILYNIISG